MAGRYAAAVPGTRVRITPREREAVEDFWQHSPQNAGRKVGTFVSGALLFFGLLFLLSGWTDLSFGRRHLMYARVSLMMSGVLLPMACFFLWLIRSKAKHLAEDLAVGSKMVVDGIVDDKFCAVNNGMVLHCTIRVVVPPSKEPGNFSVPARVFNGLSKGDAVRCAYLPASKVLLSLASDNVFHAINSSE